jgi:hypothetical protein
MRSFLSGLGVAAGDAKNLVSDVQGIKDAENAVDAVGGTAGFLPQALTVDEAVIRAVLAQLPYRS